MKIQSKYDDKLMAGNISNLCRMVTDIKHQNQDVELGQNLQRKVHSFQIMEGSTSKVWKTSIYWNLARTETEKFFLKFKVGLNVTKTILVIVRKMIC